MARGVRSEDSLLASLCLFDPISVGDIPDLAVAYFHSKGSSETLTAISYLCCDMDDALGNEETIFITGELFHALTGYIVQEISPMIARYGCQLMA